MECYDGMYLYARVSALNLRYLLAMLPILGGCEDLLDCMECFDPLFTLKDVTVSIAKHPVTTRKLRTLAGKPIQIPGGLAARVASFGLLYGWVAGPAAGMCQGRS